MNETEGPNDYRQFRVPKAQWDVYGDIVGARGRSADLKTFITWRIENPGIRLGPDMAGPFDAFVGARVPDLMWDEFCRCTEDGEGSADLRAYVLWRIANPDQPLPGRSRWSLSLKTLQRNAA